ncbi:MAG: hypothetical protein JWO31_457 [Phycisphaerales bacterium]|nr:hypothetical protein [Phycisphaerales bacterium]
MTVVSPRKVLAVVVCAVFLAAGGCSKSSTSKGKSGIDGNYKNDKGVTVVELKGDTAYITNVKAGATNGYPCTVAGDKVTVKAPTGNIDLAVAADGTMTGAPGFRSLKRAD